MPCDRTAQRAMKRLIALIATAALLGGCATAPPPAAEKRYTASELLALKPRRF